MCQKVLRAGRRPVYLSMLHKYAFLDISCNRALILSSFFQFFVLRFTSNEAGIIFEYRLWDTYNYREIRPWTKVVSKTDVGECVCE